MWKKTPIVIIGIGLVTLIALVVVAIVLQRSPQDAALANLDAAEKILDEGKKFETPAKFEEARKALANTKLPGASQAVVSQALAAIDDLEASVESERTKSNALSSEAKSQISQAKANLSPPGVEERAKGVRDLLLALLWPVAIVLIVIYTLHSERSLNLFKQLAATVSKLTVPGGLEIDFQSTEVKRKQEEVLNDYRQQAISKYDGVANQYQITETVSRIVKGPVTEFFKQRGLSPKFRCTLHVRDILFDNSLYQLIDYVGKKGVGKGRAWSVRRGMIGRCWRLERSEAKGSVPKDEIALIDNWALTRSELDGANKNQTILCHLIKAKNESPLALFYMDSEPQNAFGDESKMGELMGIIEAEVKRLELDKSLEQVWQQVQASAPLITIYNDQFAR